MTGTVQKFALTFGSFGQQYTTIDGVEYVTWFDLCDPRLKGFREGAVVEYEPRLGPTVLCHSPHYVLGLPSAAIKGVL
jgi:hypothetical protein